MITVNYEKTIPIPALLMNKKSEELTDQQILQELTQILKEKKQLLRKKERLFLQEVKWFTLITAVIISFHSLEAIIPANQDTCTIFAIITTTFLWFIWLGILITKYKSIAKEKQEDE